MGRGGKGAGAVGDSWVQGALHHEPPTAQCTHKPHSISGSPAAIPGPKASATPYTRNISTLNDWDGRGDVGNSGKPRSPPPSGFLGQRNEPPVSPDKGFKKMRGAG